MHIFIFIIGVFFAIRRVLRIYFDTTSFTDSKNNKYVSVYDVHREVNQPIYRFFYIIRLVIPFCFFVFGLVAFVWLTIAITSPDFKMGGMPDWVIKLGQDVMKDVVSKVPSVQN